MLYQGTVEEIRIGRLNGYVFSIQFPFEYVLGVLIGVSHSKIFFLHHDGEPEDAS